jgi:uncharacterized protein (TIGR02611 family)
VPEHPSSNTPAVPTAEARPASPHERSPFDLHSPADWLRWIGRSTKRLAVLVVGVAILGAGVAMLALPGPGVLVIVVGLAVLATEFAWAERALDRTTAKAATAATKVSGSRSGRLALMASGIGMVVGGATVVALVGSYRVIGASIAVAGLIGLGTLHPRVQRWLDSRAAPRPSSADEISPVTSLATPAVVPAPVPAVVPAPVPAVVPAPIPPASIPSTAVPPSRSSTHHTNGDRP